MSSFLEKQQAAFKSNLASAASKIGNPSSAATTKASTLAPPSPSPSAHSDTNHTPTAKRKRDAVPDVPYSQPAITGFGNELKTQMTFAIEYLKTKGGTKTAQDVINHLSLMHHAETHRSELILKLRANPRVEWKPDPKVSEQTWDTGTFAYRPAIPGVRDEVSLLSMLQQKKDAEGVPVKALKDGWPDCEETLVKMERAHKILVTRTKKDGMARQVWQDDPSLHHRVDAEFVTMWNRVRLPSVIDMHAKLTAVGQKPTGDDPNLIQQAEIKKPTKKKKTKKPTKVTNTHMAGILKNYE